MLKPEKTLGNTDWFVKDRFGLFIHFGLYALPARHEWVRNKEEISNEDYQKYFDHFNPDLLDPKEWARIAKKAGMKYFVITTKHHDGFCLFDSKFTDYKSTNTPYGKDILKELIAAFRAEDIKIGFYHSLIDWHHPEFTVDRLHPNRSNLKEREKNKDRDIKKYSEYLYNQVQELMTNYGKVDILWFDFSYDRDEPKWEGEKGKGKNEWQSEKLLKMIREKMPEIIINDRLEIDQDLKTPEQFMPRNWVKVDGKPVVWESCQTLNTSWGYFRDLDEWKSSELLVKMLIEGVSKGGNMILNVGPDARGRFEKKAIQRLEEIGDWMELHSKSIYNCTQSEFTPPENCYFTQNGKKLYLHILSWPLKQIHLDNMADKIEYAQLLNDGSEIKMLTHENDIHAHMAEDIDKNTLTLLLPVQRPDVLVPVIELFLK